MPAISCSRIAELLAPYTSDLPVTDEQTVVIQTYVELLLKWNARINLTAIRDPDELVQRQVGESLFAAQLVPPSGTLLDFGSGAGFPGIPLQLVRPRVVVTLAESQGKKAGFLREAVRTLGLPCEVWADRVESLPPSRTFDTVTMRAVDASASMLPLALTRIAPEGELIRFISARDAVKIDGWSATADLAVPLSLGRLVRSSRR